MVSEVTEVWHTVAIDLTGPSDMLCNNVYLSVIDYARRYPFFCKLKCGSFTEVIQHLKVIFSLFGLPTVIVYDNGTCFVSE